ncbi:60S ribosomal protein L27, mitochondrial [Ophidiomyces ophidiicola]|nr:60S ribosomal protein L27, mitochondrial [Ophidiomyces ophidiicola]KAI1934332.1 60S ribosomal protein L27, mitochondrial [Ophidiomyces ophidiicola]KAI1962881.1 60S ribosomal protein L27, mitochondrial [Ophidiomyces ophidiicola]
MFKPSQCLQARLRLTTKQVNGGYYKGNRTGSMGFFAPQKGKYVINWTKVRTYVVPETLSEFKLTPFVTRRMEPTRNAFTKVLQAKSGREVVVPRAYTGKDFLQEWVEENDEEVVELRRREEELGEQSEPSTEETTRTER